MSDKFKITIEYPEGFKDPKGWGGYGLEMEYTEELEQDLKAIEYHGGATDHFPRMTAEHMALEQLLDNVKDSLANHFQYKEDPNDNQC